jgi:hypothetical protein
MRARAAATSSSEGWKFVLPRYVREATSHSGSAPTSLLPEFTYVPRMICEPESEPGFVVRLFSAFRYLMMSGTEPKVAVRRMRPAEMESGRWRGPRGRVSASENEPSDDAKRQCRARA